jgi:hypothetical protein
MAVTMSIGNESMSRFGLLERFGRFPMFKLQTMLHWLTGAVLCLAANRAQTRCYQGISNGGEGGVRTKRKIA